jgi:glycosyltransferase involved in cell wall biosynthesis
MGDTVKIGLDVVPMRYPPSGVRAYVEALIEAFRSGDYGLDLIPIAPPDARILGASRLARLDWDVRGSARAARHARVDLLHMTRFAAPGSSDRPLVVTVHDLIPLELPEYRATLSSRLQTEIARRTVTRSSRIIVPSAYVAGRVEAALRIPGDRIDIIPMGVEVSVQSELPAPLLGPYVIHTGGFDARKNLPMLLRAFSQVVRELGPDWRLVLVGAPHTANQTVYPPLQPEIDRLALGNRIILTGRVSEFEKNALYDHATIAVAPSLSEGFGLPILEAMAHGIPVIASNRTAYPEVAGDVALLVEPTQSAFAEALIALAADPAHRSELSARGRQRAAQFPWSRTAELTAATYRRALTR